MAAKNKNEDQGSAEDKSAEANSASAAERDAAKAEQAAAPSNAEQAFQAGQEAQAQQDAENGDQAQLAQENNEPAQFAEAQVAAYSLGEGASADAVLQAELDVREKEQREAQARANDDGFGMSIDEVVAANHSRRARGLAPLVPGDIEQVVPEPTPREIVDVPAGAGEFGQGVGFSRVEGDLRAEPYAGALSQPGTATHQLRKREVR